MFVGLDPSYTGTGLVVLGNSAELIKFELLGSDPTHTWYDRIYRIDWLCRALETVLPWPCEYIVVEDYSYGSGFQTHQLGELGYAYRSLLLRLYGSDRIGVIPPTTIKKFITGAGNANKDKVARCVEAQIGYGFDNRNVSDACAMACFALALSHPELFNKRQSELIETWKSSKMISALTSVSEK